MAIIYESEAIAYIYALVDPETKKVRYIGKSVAPFKRLQEHMCAAKNGSTLYCCRWIKSLLSKEKRPIMKVLECVPENRWQQREIHWIAFYREHKDGKLLNMASGGTGVFQLPLGVEILRRQRMSVAKTGQKVSEAQRENMRKIGIERFKSRPEDREKLSRHFSKLTDEQIIEIWNLANLGDISQRQIAKIYNTTSSTVSEIKNGIRYKHLTEKISQQRGDVDIKKLKAKKNQQRVLELYKAGIQPREIAIKEGRSEERVRELLKAALGMSVNEYESRQRKEKVLDLLKQGYSYKEIERKLGLAHGTASTIVHRKSKYEE